MQELLLVPCDLLFAVVKQFIAGHTEQNCGSPVRKCFILRDLYQSLQSSAPLVQNIDVLKLN